MALEQATYINQLDQDNPEGLDRKSQGDDHMRLIKRVLKKTFSKITGEVVATHTDLNKTAQPGFLNQAGMIMMWPYSKETIPAGWRVCDGVGNLPDGRPVPNLLDRFVLGAGSAINPVGTVGGTAKHKHDTVVTVAGTALTVEQLPPHDHDVRIWQQYSVDGGNGGLGMVGGSLGPTSKTGGGLPHVHPTTIANPEVDSRPPFYTLFYIIKE